MSLNISYHFRLGDSIAICGHYGIRRFVALITQFDDYGIQQQQQNEGRIFLYNNNKECYCIEVQIQNDGFEEMCDLDWYHACLHESEISKKAIKQNANEPFHYMDVYGIPAYVWCVTVGMIAADL